MADLELSFSMPDRSKWSEGTFYIDGLSIIDTGDNYEVNYDDIELYLDGQLYDETAETWAGAKVNTEQFFDTILSVYQMNDNTYDFSEDWSVFDSLDSLKEYQGDLLVKLPIYRDGGVCIYELDLATPYNKYYQCADDGEVLILDEDNSIVSDMEHWYEQGLFEDITAILKGDLECLYMGYNPKAMIEESGGEDAWLNEWG